MDKLAFAGFRLDLVRAELTHSGVPIPLRPKVFQTVPRLGYRFDAAVQVERGDASKPAAVPAAAAPPQPQRRGPGRRAAYFLAAGLVVNAAVVVAGGVLRSAAPPQGIDALLAAGRSVTVIPFADLSEPNLPYFAEGVTQEITTDLIGLHDVTVVASAALAPASIAAVDVKGVGRLLGVRHVLTGAVLRAGQRVQINVQLSRADSGALEWAQRFDYANAADWNWRTDIAQRVAARLALGTRYMIAAAEAGRGNVAEARREVAELFCATRSTRRRSCPASARR